jgi:transcriptional regulator with XRE-family HTH domain
MEPKDTVLELKRLGMTQVEIADAVGCSQANISDIENGRQKRGPSYQIVVRLNDLLAKKQAESLEEQIRSTDDTQQDGGGSADATPKRRSGSGRSERKRKEAPMRI